MSEENCRVTEKEKKNVLSCGLGKPGVAQAGHKKKQTKQTLTKLIVKSYM